MPHQSFAGSVTWPTDAEVLSLGPHLEYLVDPTGTLELRDAQTSVDAWASVGEETASFGYTSDVYWFPPLCQQRLPMHHRLFFTLAIRCSIKSIF